MGGGLPNLSSNVDLNRRTSHATSLSFVLTSRLSLSLYLCMCVLLLKINCYQFCTGHPPLQSNLGWRQFPLPATAAHRPFTVAFLGKQENHCKKPDKSSDMAVFEQTSLLSVAINVACLFSKDQ
mmetsp:Transcript_66119/g.138107  ORF Transcript_66119/g.138107 Transcript_66119/m.138107 type:complete len:124 (-) Transcript_66119:9-380(-)